MIQQNDFIGTSIDCGFRLGKYSTLEKLVISVELATILLRDKTKMIEELNIRIESNNIKLYFDDEVELKGVLNEKKGTLKYPLIWLYSMNETNCEQLELKKDLIEWQKQDQNNSNYKHIFQKYLRIFFNKPDNRLKSPYIPGTEQGHLFSEKPTKYDENLVKAKKEIHNLEKGLFQE